MMKHIAKLIVAGLLAGAMVVPAHATLIGDTYNLDITLTGDYEFLGGGLDVDAMSAVADPKLHRNRAD